MRGPNVRHYEQTHIGFDEHGNEYVIDEYHDLPDLEDLQHGGAISRGLPNFKTRDGHEVERLGPGEFSVRVPGEERGVSVWTHDPEHV
ncbi:hypothetical protein CVH10_01760 [Halomonas sp. ND22Bw]|uniref:hypothetical protein n=1 Tax=Halomonas TaxID=2745 RepID=UPI000D0B6FDC|nr:hypothetical protein [Halomonas salina]PSJ23608.1 hypothetical protein CVH10_01760 [Halomonas sp. ND22Bw]